VTQQATEGVLFDPGSPEFRLDPYPTYRRLREVDPIHQFGDSVWILTRYDDCVRVLEDSRLSTIENVCLPKESADVADRRDQAWAALSAYLKALSAERRRAPQDDLISEFVRIQEDGENLSDDELANVRVLLLVAGHETTASLIGNAVYALLRSPAELRRLQSGDADWPVAIEEFLRYDPPGQVIMRRADAELDLRGRQVSEGDVVAVALAAANRDPAAFADPERLDVTRDPNPHIGFGHGPRYCLGSRLARVEALIALRTFVVRTRSLALTEEPTYKPTLVRRAPASLWIELC
jgi:cytochrome P450